MREGVRWLKCVVVIMIYEDKNFILSYLPCSPIGCFTLPSVLNLLLWVTSHRNAPAIFGRKEKGYACA